MFEEVAASREGVREPQRLGACLDTCNAFVAGYPLDSEANNAATFEQLDELIGLAHPKLFNVNDSVKPRAATSTATPESGWAK